MTPNIYAVDGPETPNPGLHYFSPNHLKAPVVEVEADLVVYGANAGGITAAIQARRMGKTAVIVTPHRHVGGLTAGGLTDTDGADPHVVGGIGGEFFRRAGAWTRLSPGKAEEVFRKMLAEAEVPVYFEQWLDRKDGVTMEGNRIVSFTTLKGSVFTGRIFIDASYEGDLLDAAGVTTTSGRDSRERFNERGAGVGHGRSQRIDAYVEPGNPKSGVIPHVLPHMPTRYNAQPGEGDNILQAFNFRMQLTDDPERRVPYPRPEGYDPADYQFIFRIMATGQKPAAPDKMGGDTNNHEVISWATGTDFVNGNWFVDETGNIVNWVQASYKEREEMFQDHVRFQQGYMYYIANDLLPEILADPRFAGEEEDLRPDRAQALHNTRLLVETVNRFGLDGAEFPDTDHWPWALYVREGRRMISDFVHHEAHVYGREVVDDVVGVSTYWPDSHLVRRYVGHGEVYAEGHLEEMPRYVEPWGVSYRSLVPREQECANLLTPWSISGTKIAFASTRMEPVLMVLGQSAGTAAVLAMEKGTSVQDVPYPALREQLLTDGQVLESDFVVNASRRWSNGSW